MDGQIPLVEIYNDCGRFAVWVNGVIYRVCKTKEEAEKIAFEIRNQEEGE